LLKSFSLLVPNFFVILSLFWCTSNICPLHSTSSTRFTHTYSYAAQRKSRHDEAASAAANAITIAPHDHKMYAVRATAAYKRRDWSAVVVEASACAKGLAAAQPSLLLKLAKGHGPSGVLRNKVGSCVCTFW